MIEFSRDGTFDVAVDESKKVTADHGARFQFMYQVLDEAAIYVLSTRTITILLLLLLFFLVVVVVAAGLPLLRALLGVSS